MELVILRSYIFITITLSVQSRALTLPFLLRPTLSIPIPLVPSDRDRNIGLVLLNPNKIFSKLSNREELVLNQSQIPLKQIDLNFLLFNSSPPDGIKLRETNKLFIFILDEIPGLPNSV